MLDSAAFLAVARLTRPTAIVDVAHNPLPYDVTGKADSVEKGGWLTRRLLAKAYQACSVVLVLGEGPRRDLLRHFPAVRRVAVCGHGDYSSVLRVGDVSPPSSAQPAVLFFGAWTTYKNLPLLLDAFELVRARMPEARLTLAGPVMPDVDLDAIRGRAQVVGNIDLRPGYVPMEALPKLFGDHRVVMFTYQTVNISGSVHMAYTFGRPVVATRVGSMADAVQDGVTGLLAAPDARSVAEATIRLLEPRTADAMGSAAARHAGQGASWSGVVTKAVRAYRDNARSR